MAKYVIFFNLKDEVFARMIDNPRPATDRVAVISKALEQVGGKVEAYYWMFGPHDGMAVFDLPDSVSTAAVSIAVGSTGSFDSLETHELFPVDQLNDILSKAKAVRGAYSPPGA